jgi:hypothetical protein
MFCRVIKVDVILINLFTVQGHNGPMNYNLMIESRQTACRD